MMNSLPGKSPIARSSSHTAVRPDPPETGRRPADPVRTQLEPDGAQARNDRAAAQGQALRGRARFFMQHPERLAGSSQVTAQRPVIPGNLHASLAAQVAPATELESVSVTVMSGSKIPGPMSFEDINKAIGSPRDRKNLHSPNQSIRREHGTSGAKVDSHFPNYQFELQHEKGKQSFKVEVSNRGTLPDGKKAPDGRSVMYQDYADMLSKMNTARQTNHSITSDVSIVRVNVVNKKMLDGIEKYKQAGKPTSGNGFIVPGNAQDDSAKNFITNMTAQKETNGSMTQNFVNTINSENAANLKLHSIEVSYPGRDAKPSIIYHYKDSANSQRAP